MMGGAAGSVLTPGVVNALIGNVASRRAELVGLAQALVAQQSVLGQEEPAQRIVQEWLEAHGFQTERVGVDAELALRDPDAGYPYRSYEGRSSVVGRLPGLGGGRSMHLSGHIDVVPVEHPALWASNPWEGVERDGAIFGRGSGDMKGGIAAYMVAAAAVSQVCHERRGEILFSTVIEEECGGNGMWSLVRAGHVGDAVLIGESTGLRMAHGATGVVWCRLVAPGGAGHSMLVSGDGPFEALSRAVAALRSVEAEINQAVADPDFASIRKSPYGMSVGKIEGGVWTASTPSYLTAHIRFGFGPETSPEEIQSRLRTAVHSAEPDVGIHFEGFRARAHNHSKTGPLADVLASAHMTVTGGSLAQMVNTGTVDARYVSTVPAYCYGGIAGNAHGTDEWVDIESLVQAATVVALTTANWTA